MRTAAGTLAIAMAVGGWLSAGPASPASAAPAGYGPFQLQSAYNLPANASGMLQTVAVVTPFDDPTAAADLATYRTQFSEWPCPQTTSLASPACFTEINESGALITPTSGTAPAANATWALRTSAQLDAISAVCPNCRVLLVEVSSAGIADVGAGVNEAVSNGANIVTTAVSQPETSEDPAWDSEYFDHPGVAITAAAGDTGYGGDGVGYPAASEYVTAVGGTTLTQAGTGSCPAATAGNRPWCETAWNDAGATVSGCSLYDPEPSWQLSGIPAADTACGSLRTVVDVAADADPATGIAVYDSGDGGWQDAGSAGTGGTSVAAAIIAGVYALAGTPAAGTYPAAYPYQHPTGLNDVTSGSTGTCTPAYLCTAGSGYDGATGLGTPRGVAAFASSGSTSGDFFNGITNMCLDANNNGTTSGTQVVIWHCDGTAGETGWAVEANGTIHKNGLCLALVTPATGDGTKTQLWQCLSGDGNQQWRPVPSASEPTALGTELVNLSTGLCLDNNDTPSNSNGTDNGTRIDLWGCAGVHPNLLWTLPYPDLGVADRLISAYPSGTGTPLCADDFNAVTTNGNKIDVWACDDNTGAQEWTIASNGTLTIDGKCMDVTGQATANGSKVGLSTCNGQTNQQWVFLSDGAIQGIESGRCLDEDSNATNGTQLEIFDCHNPPNAAQTWTAVPYESDYP
ncbi:MAG TPA: ricin-type beta-trefoil lectin domain protein [Streptosporangiaceae bacterium]